MEEIKKEQRQMDNLFYKDKFQFILLINDNIICQRYFKINGFVLDSLESEELKYVMDDVVNLIKSDLVSKSRVYSWYTVKEPLKLTGFGDGEITYFVPSENDEEDTYLESERPSDGEFVFKFAFLVDEKPLYEYIWDGNVYPKYVRNSVDLTNSDAAYRDKDPMSLHFSLAIIRRMTVDKTDLTYTIIKKLCDVLSNTYTDANGNYVKKTVYGGGINNKSMTYYYSSKNRNLVNEWRKYTEQKTRQWENYVNNNISQRHLDYIDKYL